MSEQWWIKYQAEQRHLQASNNARTDLFARYPEINVDNFYDANEYWLERLEFWKDKYNVSNGQC